jgi:hypothetical protein
VFVGGAGGAGPDPGGAAAGALPGVLQRLLGCGPGGDPLLGLDQDREPQLRGGAGGVREQETGDWPLTLMSAPDSGVSWRTGANDCGRAAFRAVASANSMPT